MTIPANRELPSSKAEKRTQEYDGYAPTNLHFSLRFRTTSPSQRTYKNYRVRKERNCEYGTVQLRSLA